MITNNIPRLDIAQTKSDDYSKFEEDEQVLIIKLLELKLVKALRELRVATHMQEIATINLFARNKRDSKAKSHLEEISMYIKIKKIDKMFSFCGLNEVCTDREFEGYNVFFADNGVGKTSVTRAFGLLIKQNSQHISRYKTIDSQDDPQISFLTNSGAITIDSANSATNLPFKIEIYNSDFLIQNAPMSSDFVLKKLDDETIVLSDSYLGEETKEEKELEQEKNKLQKRKDEINKSQANPDIKDEITKTKEAIKNTDDEIEKIRKNITTREIQINSNEIEIEIESDALNGENNFNVDEKELQEKQTKFTQLNNAIKSFTDLPDINFCKILPLKRRYLTRILKTS